MATVDSHGDVLNTYISHRRIDGPAPDVPWAVYLANDDTRFRLLAFDLDAKSANSKDAAARDAETLRTLLEDAGLHPVVCESGPSGGRHVWTALTETVDAETVATMARLARHVCPSLDIAPLTNAVTGCVRPPGAPHRSGGQSIVLSGDLDSLTDPQGTVHQVHQLIEALAQRVGNADHDHGDRAATGPLPLDAHARLYLPGPRKELPAVSAAALREDAASGDASAVLWRVLIGAASARWRHADIAALVDQAPGLEHVRTYRDRSQRRPRSRMDAIRVLRRQWDKAVKHVASSPRQIGTDPTFDARAHAIAAHVRDIQTRADATPGRWTTRGGPADRRVLDVLCMLALQALQGTVEADIRRVALLAGIGRETARTALLRLATDGWIIRSRHASGPNGAHWTIRPTTSIHRDLDGSRSQADPRPVGAGSAERSILLTELTDRTQAAAHDLFTPGQGLGHYAGNIYSRLTNNPTPLHELAQRIGDTPEQVVGVLGQLNALRVIQRTPHGWHRAALALRTLAARELGTDGYLATRRRQYRIEREMWAWWLAEQTWMRAPRRQSSKQRPGRGQLSLLPDDGTHSYGPHPRTTDGRMNWSEARRIIEDERNNQAQRRTPPHPDLDADKLIA